MIKRWVLRNISFRPWIKNLIRKRLKDHNISYLGCELSLCLRDNYTEYHLWLNERAPEHDAMIYLCQKLAGKNGTIIDVGANAGVFGLPILQAAGPQMRYLGVEPNPVIAARLLKNIQQNSFSQALVLEHAISDTTGTVKMFFPTGNNLGQGRISLPYSGRARYQPFLVKTKTMLDCLQDEKNSGIDLLKVDVEGLEDRVIWPLLDGPENNWPKRVYLEVAHQEAWQYPLLEKLAECGYKLEQDFGENELYLRK